MGLNGCEPLYPLCMWLQCFPGPGAQERFLLFAEKWGAFHSHVSKCPALIAQLLAELRLKTRLVDKAGMSESVTINATKLLI